MLNSHAKRQWPIGVLLAIVLVLAACSPGGQTPGSSNGNVAADPNGELNTNTGGEPDTIDPQKESFLNEIAQTLMVFEPLMNFDPKTLRPVPAAAKAAPTVSSDGLTYTYTLRDGTKFSDGSAVTAGNFVYSWLRLCDPNVAGEYAFSGYIIVGCQKYNEMDPKKATPAELTAARAAVGVKALSDTQIEFKLTEPAPYFQSLTALWFSVPVRESDVSKGGDKWTEPATFVGNGAFKLTEWKHNEKMTYERNDNYRNPAKLKKWTKVMINENAVAFAAYRNNELDLVGVAAEQLRTVESDADLKAQEVTVPGSCSFYYGFNLAKAPFDDVKVRQAFSKSFDRTAYITDVQKIGKPTETFIPDGLPGYDKDDHAQAYDVAAAKALLAGSTYAGKPVLDQIKFTYSSSAAAKTRVEWVQQQWKTNLGINVTLDPVDRTTFSQLVKKTETTPQLFLLGWCADYPDQQDWLTTVWISNSSTQHTSYNNPAFDKLVRAADKETDPKKRDDMYQQATRLLSSDAPAAWIYDSETRYLMKPWVKGIVNSAIDSEFGQLSFAEISVGAKK